MANKKTSPTEKTTSPTQGKAPANSDKSIAAKASDGFDLLKAQHKDIRIRAQKLGKHLLQQVNRNSQASAGNAAGQQKSTEETDVSADTALLKDLKTLCQVWIRHSRLEEEVVFPALEEAGVEPSLLQQAEVQRDLAILLLDSMANREASDPLLQGEAAVFCELAPRLARFEESSLFAAAKRLKLDTAALGQELQHHGEDKTKNSDQAEEINSVPRPRHLRGVTASQKEYMTMPMRGQERDRDERGRFTDDDDHRGRGRGSSYSRSSSPSRGSGRYEDDGDNRGWHGDSRGHSEASRRGWEERRGSSGSGRGDRYEVEDDDRHSSRGGRSSSMNRNGGGGRRTGGWFGDSEGHSEASRRGWENSDHGDSGWYGDREGHSQASRRGWQNPDHGDSGWYGDREGHSQASRRGWENPNHGDSGWFGDREGHSEASRRGWRTRRDEDDDYDDRRRSSRRGRD